MSRRVAKSSRRVTLPADPRPKALVRYEAVTGYVFHNDRGRVFLMTSDRKRHITDLEIVKRYVSPRHEPGTEMIMYRGFVHGVEFVGRSSGLVLTLRPRQPGGFH